MVECLGGAGIGGMNSEMRNGESHCENRKVYGGLSDRSAKVSLRLFVDRFSCS